MKRFLLHILRLLRIIATATALLLVSSSSSSFVLGFPQEGDHNPRMATLGGVRDSKGFQNGAKVGELARFAVQEHNKRENSLVEFSRLVKAKEQMVAGTLYHLTLEGMESGKKMLYEAKVWVKPWMDFKELQEFKPLDQPPATFTTCDLGAKPGGHEPGWREVPAHDPVVQDAANHAVRAIQQRSNSLIPYELLEILLAKAEVFEELAKFNLHLKVKRGSKEEKLMVEVHKSMEGNFLLCQMQQDHSE